VKKPKLIPDQELVCREVRVNKKHMMKFIVMYWKGVMVFYKVFSGPELLIEMDDRRRIAIFRKPSAKEWDTIHAHDEIMEVCR
jgi:hypothetical protein